MKTTPIHRQMKRDENTFLFLNVKRRLDPGHFDWWPRDVGKLWRYNLHYFDYLQEENRPVQNKAFLVNSWIRNVPEGAEDAWEPFPVSLRIVNWIKWFLSPEVNKNPSDAWLKSLFKQALWLEKNVEYHLLANHLYKNGKALLFAGFFFEGSDDAGRWLEKGLEILLSELQEQILPDGGHFERSPMYHSMILEDCLDLLNISNKCWEAGRLGSSEAKQQIGLLQEVLQEKIEKMAKFLWVMTHPDGRIALFNDAAFDIEAEPEELFSYYERVTGKFIDHDVPRIQSFPETGYFIITPNPEDRIIIDCGPVGPDYQPGHSHCDTLSFELSLGGRRVVVDSGCCQYEDADIRRYNRGNVGHNTVTVDGENQSEVWGAHRCAWRARPVSSELYKTGDGTLVFEGAHNGYTRLPGRPIHFRKVSWHGNDIRIEDRIEGKGRHTLESRLHIHPDMLVGVEGESILIRADSKPIVSISANGPGHIEIKDGWHCPEFGLQKSCKVLCLEYKTTPLPFNTGWRFQVLS